MHTHIEMKEMPHMQLAYVSHVGVAGLEHTFERIATWAKAQGILEGENSHMIRIFHDSFKDTDADKVRMSIGVILNQELHVDSPIEKMNIEKGKHLVGRFTLEPKEFGQAWQELFIWLNVNGFKKSKGNPFELYYNNLNDHPERKCLVDLCIPIE